MKKIGEYFQEMGFNEKASDETKKAFLKHLIKEAQRQDFKRRPPKQKQQNSETITPKKRNHKSAS